MSDREDFEQWLEVFRQGLEAKESGLSDSRAWEGFSLGAEAAYSRYQAQFEWKVKSWRTNEELDKEHIKQLMAENRLLRAEAGIGSPVVTGNPYEQEMRDKIMELEVGIVELNREITSMRAKLKENK